MSRDRRLEAAMPWLVTIGIFVVWELTVIAFDMPEFVLPRPTVVWQAFLEFRGPIMGHALHTLYTTVAGFAFAVVGGVLLGVAVGSSVLVYNGLYPVPDRLSTSIPKVGDRGTVLVVWFGIAEVRRINHRLLISFFPIAVNVRPVSHAR